MAGRTVRAFIAVPLDQQLQRTLATLQERMRPLLPGVRWSAPHTTHLTLCFLGDVAEEVLEKLPKVMLSVAGSQPPFSVRVGGVGAFPHLRQPRVVWVGLDGGTALPELQSRLTQGVAGLGLPLEHRPFHPHLTLGRCRERVAAADQLLAPYLDVDCGRLLVDHIVLYESRLAPAGAQHLPRAVIPLGEGGAGDPPMLHGG